MGWFKARRAKRRYRRDLRGWQEWERLRATDRIVWIAQIRQHARTGTKGYFTDSDGRTYAFWAPKQRLEAGVWAGCSRLTRRGSSSPSPHREIVHDIIVESTAPPAFFDAWQRLEQNRS